MLSITIIVISLSIIIQLASSILALRLIKVTGYKYSWVSISIALFLMSIRRIIPLFKMLTGLSLTMDIFTEVIGLVISILMLLGVIWYKRNIH